VLAAQCEHEIVTTAFMGWTNLKNGELLKSAEEGGFDVFVTGDRSMVNEQNLSGPRHLAILSLSTNNWPILKHHCQRILDAINLATSGSFQQVDCGTFFRRKPIDE